MKMYFRQGLLFFFLMLSSAAGYAMKELDDRELGGISGQAGVSVSMEYYYNSMRTSDPTTTGAGLGKCTDGGLGDTDCRLAWQLSGRGAAATQGIYEATTWTLPGGGGCDGSSTCRGEWLVWKAGWASLVVNDLNLDAAFLGDAASAGSDYEHWLINNSQLGGSFADSSGSCLMPADRSGAYGTCTVDYMKAMPALRTHYANTGGTYDPTSRTTTGYNDALFGLEVTGLSAEYDTAGQPGWELNNHGSFTSLKIADNHGHQAGIAFGGSFYLYGF